MSAVSAPDQDGPRSGSFCRGAQPGAGLQSTDFRLSASRACPTRSRLSCSPRRTWRGHRPVRSHDPTVPRPARRNASVPARTARTGTGEFLKAGQAVLEEALAPRADNFAAGVETAGDDVIAEALGGEQDHPGARDPKARQRIAAGAAMEFSTLLVGQDDAIGAVA